MAPYPYGTLPTGASDTDVTNAYNLWKSRRLVTASCGQRVDNGSGGTTVSEGMGYGMLMAAYLESTDTELANLYTFYSANFDSRGLMNWSVSSGSCSNNSANAATDGDLDAALALVKAAKKWPASSNNWASKATTLLNNIYSYEVDSCKGLANGDTWGGCTNASPKNYNPSYFRTGYLKSFDCFEGGTRWSAVRTQSYSVLNYTILNYKLPPDWVQANGSWGASDAGGGYGYDSCRTPWAVGMDYLWWGNSSAQSLDNNVTASFAAQGAASTIGDDYNYQSGAKDSNNHENEFIGAVGVASMVGTNSAFRDSLYAELVKTDNNTYFSDSLKVIYLMAMTGNFQEPCNGGGSPGTPTPTASPTRTRTPSPSATATASPTRTRTPSPSATATASPTPSPSPSPSPTPLNSPVKTATPSPSVSPSPSGTITQSPSPTPTASSTVTLSVTPSRTASGSPSPTASPSSTRSASATVSPSASPTATATVTVTPSFSVSPTGTPYAGSPTDTPTPSPSSTASPSGSVTPTSTPTGSPSLTPTVSASPTVTATASATSSPSGTASATTTASPSATASATGSATQTPSATASLILSPSASPTVTASPVGTVTASPTVSPSFSATASPTASFSATATATPSPNRISTASPTATLSSTVVPATGSGPLAIGKHSPFPSPWTGQGPAGLAVEMLGDCDGLRLRLYSPAMACVGSVDLGPQPKGWDRVVLPAGLAQALNSGVYYYSLQAVRGTARSLRVLGVWMVLR